MCPARPIADFAGLKYADYLRKPYSADELRAKALALLKARDRNAPAEAVL
jgi:hypothetical protein